MVHCIGSVWRQQVGGCVCPLRNRGVAVPSGYLHVLFWISPLGWSLAKGYVPFFLPFYLESFWEDYSSHSHGAFIYMLHFELLDDFISWKHECIMCEFCSSQIRECSVKIGLQWTVVREVLQAHFHVVNMVLKQSVLLLLINPLPKEIEADWRGLKGGGFWLVGDLTSFNPSCSSSIPLKSNKPLGVEIDRVCSIIR